MTCIVQNINCFCTTEKCNDEKVLEDCEPKVSVNPYLMIIHILIIIIITKIIIIMILLRLKQLLLNLLLSQRMEPRERCGISPFADNILT